jgi:hypothetical protein
MKQGEEGDKLYIICSGSLVAEKKDPATLKVTTVY